MHTDFSIIMNMSTSIECLAVVKLDEDLKLIGNSDSGSSVVIIVDGGLL